jgi:hypothetical protein
VVADHRQLFRRKGNAVVVPQHLCLAHAGDARRTDVPHQVAAGAILHEDAVGRRVNHRPEQRLGAVPGIFGSGPGGKRLALQAKQPLHRQVQHGCADD